MKVFSHGSIANFQASTREMFASDLERLIHHMIQRTDRVLVGTIHLDREELRIYGHVHSVKLDEEENQCKISFIPVEESDFAVIQHPFADLLISHEARFDIVDEEKGQVSYEVIYVTFEAPESGEEITYFFADEQGVSEPLACVAEFWQHVSVVGRDVDFNLSGCTAHEFSRIRGCNPGKCDSCDGE